jgi:DNA invertase Pin-like site-specific DNA recombinase
MRRALDSYSGKRAVGYGRISDDPTGLQAGVGRQREDVERWCQENDVQLVDWIEDNDVSASRYGRKVRQGYRKALRMVESGQAEILVAWHVDRLYRQPKELEHLIDLAEKQGVLIATLNGRLDLADSDDRAMARVAVAIAAKSSDDTSRRVTRWHTSRRDQGLPAGGPIFGWLSATEQDPRTAPIVARMIERCLAGEGLASIARWLDAEQVPQRLGGKCWQHNSVRLVLGSPRHYGLLAHRGQIVGPSTVPGIVEPELYEQVQAVLSARRTARKPSRRTAFTGLLFCAECGHSMIRNGGEKGRPVWVCKRSGYKPDACGKVSIDASFVERAILDAVFGIVDDPKLARMAAQMTARKGKGTTEGEIAAKLAALSTRLDALVEQFATGELPADAYARAARRLEADRQALTEELAKVSSAGVLVPWVGKAGELRAAFDEPGRLSDDMKREIIGWAFSLDGVRFEVGKHKGAPRVPDTTRCQVVPLPAVERQQVA